MKTIFSKQALCTLAFLLTTAFMSGCGEKSCPTCVRDNAPPTVISVQPSNGDTSASITIAIKATFSEPIDPASITPATFTLIQGSSLVSGTLTASGAVATFTPSQPLAYQQSYVATVTSGVKDIAGNNLAGPYSWTFATMRDSTLWSLDSGSAMTHLVLDANGLYFIGFIAPNRHDFIQGRFDLGGRRRWLDTVSTADVDWPRCVAAYGGNVYSVRWQDPTGLGGAPMYLDRRDAQTGALKWSVLVANPGDGCVAADKDGLYVGWSVGWTGFLAKLDTATGAVLKPVSIPGGAIQYVALSGRGVYAGGITPTSLVGGQSSGAIDLFLAAYSKDLGQAQWLRQYGTGFPSSGGLVVTTPNSIVLAGNSGDPSRGTARALGYDQATGKLLWIQDGADFGALGMVRGVASDSAGNTYVVPGPAKLRPDGTIAWLNQGAARLDPEDTFGHISAGVRNDTLYVVNGTNQVRLLNASTGSRLQ